MLHKMHNWKRFTNFVKSVSVKGKNDKYDCYIKRTTDNVLKFCYKRLGEG
jgi:hypothetical protein